MPTSSTTATNKTILVTGGAGYIGSHTVLALLNDGWAVVVLDNLCNSTEESLERVMKISGKSVIFHKIDLLNKEAVDLLFQKYTFWAVVHFAGLKAVGESVQIPLHYYHNNITGTLHLVEVMKRYNVKKLVFSSSATVYGEPERLPLTEECRLGATNPYGRTKQFIEEILGDVAASDASWDIVLLRYFNPVGAHESGLIGEDPKGIPNNLMPFVSQVAVGKRACVNVFGNDYDTADGTGVRDYIHVVDLALGHVAALRKLESTTGGCLVYNLGTGVGYSVLQMIQAMAKASGREIPYKFTVRRAGDVAMVYADPSKAHAELNWKAERDLDEMCSDMWKWQSNNPDGFELKQETVKGTKRPLASMAEPALSDL